MSGANDTQAQAAASSRVEAEAVRVARDPVLAHMLNEERVETTGRDVTLMKRLLGHLGPHKGLAAACVAMALLEALVMTLPPFVLGLAMDRAAGVTTRSHGLIATLLGRSAEHVLTWFGHAPTDLAATVAWFGAVTAGVWVLRLGVAILTSYWVQQLSQLILHDLRVEIYRHIVGMDRNCFLTRLRSRCGTCCSSWC